MVKTLKEYLGVPTIRVGGLDAMQHGVFKWRL